LRTPFLVLGITSVFQVGLIPPAVGKWVLVAAAGLVLELAILLLGRRFLPGPTPLNLRNWLTLAAWMVVVLAVAQMALATVPPRPDLAWLIIGLAAAWALVWAVPALRRVTIRVEAEICRPPAEVFAYVTDHERIPTWQETVSSIETLPALPGIERRYRRTDRQPNGYDEVAEVRVLEEQAPELIVSSLSYGRLTYTTTSRLVAAGCGTRLSLSLAPRLPWAACVLGGQFNGVKATNTERIAHTWPGSSSSWTRIRS
jgi:uncharacterized protein YndB with AHSA1/START domain